jgi:hypothetical protein
MASLRSGSLPGMPTSSAGLRSSVLAITRRRNSRAKRGLQELKAEQEGMAELRNVYTNPSGIPD